MGKNKKARKAFHSKKAGAGPTEKKRQSRA